MRGEQPMLAAVLKVVSESINRQVAGAYPVSCRAGAA